MSKETLTPNRVSFDVSYVKPSTERLPEIPLRKALERSVRIGLIACPKGEQMVVEDADFQPLIAAAAIAYKQHYPLVLSPDMIWLTILQGVAQHVANDPERLRSRFVSHQTRIELVVNTTLRQVPRTDAEMILATNGFMELIEKHTPPDKRFLLRVTFSTTTDVERIAGAIVVMDAFQPYFDYVFRIICGIPSVTLEGTTADWELLSEKVQLLHDSDLELSWWTKHLLPLCDQFARASRGEVDREHWQNLCKIYERYGADDLNGWLLKFIPYVRKERNETPTERNPVLELLSFGDQSGQSPEGPYKITGCTSNMLPTGMSRVPVVCQNSSSGEALNLEFLAGLVGVSQEAEDLSVRPVVGWAITQQAGIDVIIEKLRTRYGCKSPPEQEPLEMAEFFDGNLPGEMWKYYSQIDGFSLTFPKPNQYNESYCHVASFEYVKPLWDSGSVIGELECLRSQGEISDTLFAERKEFARNYGRLRIIAQTNYGNRSAYYVFGRVPGSDAQVFRWTGKRTLEAFAPVARSFTEWLSDILKAASGQD